MSKFLSFFVSNLIIKFFMFGSQILVALYLTPKEMGGIKTTQTIVELVVTLSILGLNTAFLREYSISKQEHEKKEIKSFCFNLILYASVLITFFSILMANFSTINIYSILYLTVPFVSLSTLIIYFYQVDDMYLKLSLSQFKVKMISASLIIISTYFFGVIGFLISTVILSIFSFYYLLRPFIRDIKHFKYNKILATRCFNISKYALLSTVLGVITNYTSFYIASGLYQDSNALGYLAFAMNIFLAFEILTSTIQQYFLPKLTKLSDTIKIWEIEFNKLNVKLIMSHLILSVFFYYTFSSLESLSIVKDFKYYDSIYYLKIFIISWGISGFSAYKLIAILSLGRVKYTFIYNIIMLPIVIISSYFFISKYNVDGVVYGKVFISLISCFIIKYCFFLAVKIFK
ncbi:lipopolysaccharide biosynthesis protein [Photobacterium leiognathi]|uniref:lipopolysaccharide biosynthesis protein n=1 Tax=Photobacterium leiognathi TaxID=553611 RepID=UPI002980E11D|nr:oligosaccharide flippase family protein [Photobacterium leiognathi]